MNDNGTMTITGCTISNNSATEWISTRFKTRDHGPAALEGGGILNDSGGSLIITNSTISGNTCSAD